MNKPKAYYLNLVCTVSNEMYVGINAGYKNMATNGPFIYIKVKEKKISTKNPILSHLDIKGYLMCLLQRSSKKSNKGPKLIRARDYILGCPIEQQKDIKYVYNFLKNGGE